MLTTTPDLTKRTPEAEAFYNIKANDVTNFHVKRPVIMMRSGTGQYGISLEYSHCGGRGWHIMSFHETIFEALEAFAAIRDGIGGKDRDPRHYRILKESV